MKKYITLSGTQRISNGEICYIESLAVLPKLPAEYIGNLAAAYNNNAINQCQLQIPVRFNSALFCPASRKDGKCILVLSNATTAITS